MAKKQIFDPEVFQDMPAVKVLELDVTKPYMIMMPKSTPDEIVKGMSDTLSTLGIFSLIMCCDPKDCQVFGSVPVYVEPRADMIRVPMTGDLRLAIMEQLKNLGCFKPPRKSKKATTIRASKPKKSRKKEVASGDSPTQD